MEDWRNGETLKQRDGSTRCWTETREREQRGRTVQKHRKDQSWWEKNKRLLKVAGTALDVPVRTTLGL